MVNITSLRFILLFMLSLTSTAYANVDASLNRSSMQLGETVQLTISIDDTSFFGSPDPDTSVLNDKFDILGQQKNFQKSIINGKGTSITQWVYALSPKSVGIITIPSISVNDEQSHPISLKVENPDNSSNTTNKPIFMESALNKNTAYVQEQLLLTLHINSSIDAQNIQFQLQPPSFDNATITQLTNTRYERQINGVPYTTYEVVYAITPQRSGDLTIPNIKAEGIVPDPSGGNSFRKIQLQTNELTLHVNASPSTDKTWLPANDVQLHETWSSDPENITVGDSISRILEITATGLNAKQLPELAMQGNEFFKVYQDKANENDNKTDQGIVSTKKQNITLVATKAGKVELPAIDIQWWDVQSNTFKNTRLAAVTLHIKDNATTAQSSNNLPPAINNIPTITPNPLPTQITNNKLTSNNNGSNTNSLLWQIIALVNGILAFIFAGLWLSNKKYPKQKTTMPNESLVNSTNSNPLKALKTACINKQFSAIKIALIEWAKIQYPTQKIHSLIDIQQLLNNKDVSLWLNNLDKAIYKNEGNNEDWLAFYEIIHRLHHDKIEKDKALPPLYPKN